MIKINFIIMFLNMSGPIDSNPPIPEQDLNKIDDSYGLSKTNNEVQSAYQKRFSKNLDKISSDAIFEAFDKSYQISRKNPFTSGMGCKYRAKLA